MRKGSESAKQCADEKGGINTFSLEGAPAALCQQKVIKDALVKFVIFNLATKGR